MLSGSFSLELVVQCGLQAWGLQHVSATWPRPVQNVPGEGEVEEGSIALFRWIFITVDGVFLSNKSELSAILWQRPGTAWAPPSGLPSHCFPPKQCCPSRAGGGEVSES